MREARSGALATLMASSATPIAHWLRRQRGRRLAAAAISRLAVHTRTSWRTRGLLMLDDARRAIRSKARGDADGTAAVTADPAARRRLSGAPARGRDVRGFGTSRSIASAQGRALRRRFRAHRPHNQARGHRAHLAGAESLVEAEPEILETT